MADENKKAMEYAVKLASELGDAHADFSKALGDVLKEVKAAEGRLFKSGGKPWLVRLGLALIAFPEPVLSDLVGTLMVAAGTVQAGLQRHALYVDDVPKVLKNLMRDLLSVGENARSLR